MNKYWRRELRGATTRKERQEIRYMADKEEYDKMQRKEIYLDSFNQLPDFQAVTYSKTFRDFVPSVHLDWMERAELEIDKYSNVFDKAITTRWVQFVLTSGLIWLMVGVLYWLSFLSLICYAGIAIVLVMQIRLMSQTSKVVDQIKEKQGIRIKEIMDHYLKKQKEEKEMAEKEEKEYEDEKAQHIEFVEKMLAGDEAVVMARVEKLLRDYVYTLLFDIKIEIGSYKNYPCINLFMPMRSAVVPDKTATLDGKKLQLQPKGLIDMNEQYKKLWLSCLLRAVQMMFENIPVFKIVACNVSMEEGTGYRRIWTGNFSREQIVKFCNLSHIKQVWIAIKPAISPEEQEKIDDDIFDGLDDVPEIVPDIWAEAGKTEIKWINIEK